jgi:K+-transporting ATPase ATPase C chain
MPSGTWHKPVLLGNPYLLRRLTVKSEVRACLILFVLLTGLTGFVYPAIVTLVAQGAFSYQANGSVVVRDGKAVGSELIGQAFDDARYFWGRPSATDPTPYNAASSNGSNLGPTNPDLISAVRKRVEAIRKGHPDQTGPVPVDLVTSSGSGLDPDISPAAAAYQVMRVAKARGLSPDAVRRLVAEHTAPRTLGILGEPRVNVLQLNLSLDKP